MVEDELPVNDEGNSVPPEGPRRSTFTPPPAGVSYDPASTDDDALAGALSQQFQRWAPPTAPSATPQPSPPPAPSAAPEASPVAEPSRESVPSSESVSSPAVDSSIPPPPQRQSLTDEELLAAADLDDPSHDTSALLDLVERELQLRQQEAERLAAWEQSVREQVGADAEQLVSEVRSTFTGVVPIVAPVDPAPPITTAPPPVSPAPPVSPPPPVASAPSGPELDLALADAPPPLGAAVTEVPPPPGSVPAPPELVEPSIPDTGSVAISAPTAFEALLAAADAPTGENVAAMAPAEATTDVQSEPWSLGDTVIEPLPSAETTAVVDEPGELDAAEAVPLAPARAPRVEQSALEPTPAELRSGRSVRLFWLWFAVNASVVSVALGAVLLGMGMSLRQSILSALIGVAVSFLPLGLGTLASKWSGQPTMVVSRATFGTAGNAIPAVLAFVTRLVWAGALLWLLGTGVAEVLVGSGLLGDVPRFGLALIVSATGLVIAAVLAGLGFRAIAALGAVVTALGVVLVGALIVLTVPYVDLGAALSLADGPWVLMASGAVLVFSVVGLAWANSSGDIARYQAKGTYGSSAVLWSTFGATIPAFALISWGALLAASNPFVAGGLVSNPVDIIARMLPVWYPVPLVLAVGLGLIAAATLALYSGGFALLALGIRSSRPVSVLIVVIVTGAITAGLALLVVDMTTLFRDVVTTLAVPVAAWAGIFGAETMIRTRRVHSPSLLAAGGVYPRVRWVNTVMLLVITAIGWGFTTAVVAGLQWQGYLWGVLGIPLDSALGASDIGVGVALALGLLTPLAAGIPALRALQTAEREAAEADTPAARNDDLVTAATPSAP